MAETSDDNVPDGCAAWLNNKFEKARNRRRVRKDGKKYTQLTPMDKMAVTAAGDTTPIDTKKQELRPRSAVVDMKEDMHSLRTMIASLDTADCAKNEPTSDKLCHLSDVLPGSDIDVDLTVWDVLRKASRECEEELRSVKDTTASNSSPTLTSGLSSCPSLVETLVGEPLTAPSDELLDDDIENLCKQIGTEL